MSECACQPGAIEDGWQEQRCEACIHAEIAEWGHVMAWALNGDIVKRLQSKRNEA